MGKYEKQKGDRFERATVNTARELGIGAERLLGQARNGGADVRLDLMSLEYVRRPLDIECKTGTRIPLRAAFAQAQKAAEESGHTTWVRAHYTNGETFWLIPDDDVWPFLELLKP